MKLRKATQEDIERIDEIYSIGTFDEEKLENKKLTWKNWEKNMYKYEKERLESFKKGIKSKKEYWVVAEENNKIIGFGQTYIVNPNQAEIMKLDVLEDFRGKGIASQIEKELENWLKNKRIKKAFSRILLTNKPSLKFHEKNGFKKTAVRMDKELK